jgi:hypothetical protein
MRLQSSNSLHHGAMTHNAAQPMLTIKQTSLKLIKHRVSFAAVVLIITLPNTLAA